MEYVDHILTTEKAYRLRDPEAARVDNDAIGATVWDSKTVIERLCPSFTVSGASGSSRVTSSSPVTRAKSCAPSPRVTMLCS